MYTNLQYVHKYGYMIYKINIKFLKMLANINK